MSARGPVPKDPAQRRRSSRGEKEVPMVDLPSDTGPVPPPELPHADTYCEDTLRWWNVWVNSPQGKTFLATDWHRLVMLAPVVEEHSQRPSVKTMAEIRQVESKLGATVADRLRVFADPRGVVIGKPGKLDDDLSKRRSQRKLRAAVE